jgi:drug/metabolite transporter (DMT)-like permease
MEVSLFLAQFWGWYMLIFFFILSLNPVRIKQIFADLKDEKFQILVAFVAIVIGLLNVLLHNIWEPDWRFIITLLGWSSLLLGLGLFIFPVSTTKKLEVVNVKLVQVIYFLLFLLGIFLLNMGYRIVQY